MNILSIGNSFSEDATYYFKKIAAGAGRDITVVNPYIGGCSLEKHAENIKSSAVIYDYQLNGEHTLRRVSLPEVIKENKWDIITIQQQSAKAGIYESYGEHLNAVLDFIRESSPGSKIYLFQTWAYETDRAHPDFELYGNDQQLMQRKINETVKRVAADCGGLPIIPCGEVIANVRKHPLFDYKNGGESLCRDGFHMNLIYGRYLLGLVWYAALLGGDVDSTAFIPKESDLINGYTVENFNVDPDKIQVIKEAVKRIVQ